MEKIEATKVVERLMKYPHIFERMKALLDITENTSGKLDRADDAEEQLIVEINKISNELLQSWAVNQEEKKAKAIREDENVIVHSKKNYIGSQPLGK